MEYTSVFFILSCGIAMTYMWLIPYVTEFTSPMHRKLHAFKFNSSSFKLYEVYDLDDWKEFQVHVNGQNISCLAFVYTDGHTQWMQFPIVNQTFTFRIPISLITAIKLQCKKEVEFIFTKSHEWLVYPILREDNKTFVCPTHSSCTFDVSLSLKSFLLERESKNGLRRFVISRSQETCLEAHHSL